MANLRLAFMGTSDFATPCLRVLAGAGHDIAAVYTQPPRRSGRGMKLKPSPVQLVAQDLGLTVRTPESLKQGDTQAEFKALGLDACVVVAYGLILPAVVLPSPPRQVVVEDHFDLAKFVCPANLAPPVGTTVIDQQLTTHAFNTAIRI